MISMITAFQLLLFLTEEYFPQNQGETSVNVSDNKQLERWRAELDSLSKQDAVVNTRRMYPFNPNYLTDYKGYLLGLSVAEIDRLFAFRAKGKFLSSADDLEETIRVYEQFEVIVPPLVFKPQTIIPGRSLNGLIIYDTADLEDKAEGEFNVVISIEGEEHKFIFSRSI